MTMSAVNIATLTKTSSPTGRSQYVVKFAGRQVTVSVDLALSGDARRHAAIRDGLDRMGLSVEAIDTDTASDDRFWVTIA